MRLIRPLLATAMLLWTQGCESTKPQATAQTSDSACLWLHPIMLSADYPKRLTRMEKQEILALNQKIAAACR
jgi:hypothetical protein